MGEWDRMMEVFQEKGLVTNDELDFITKQGQAATTLVSLVSIVIGQEPCIMAMAHDITERKHSEMELRRAQAELSQHMQARATTEERQRLARELHDSVSQALYGISLGAHTALALLDTDRAKVLEALNYVLSQAQAGLAEMRALLFELRPESLEMEGLVTALNKQAAALRARHGIEVGLQVCQEPDVPLPVKEALYRIAQEALQNAVKHARPNRLDVRLTCAPDSLRLEVCDNGVGFDPLALYPGHLGLRSMRERATRVGGTLDIESVPDGGTQVRARVPVRAAPSA
jgi:signal transduction histidine kinase